MRNYIAVISLQEDVAYVSSDLLKALNEYKNIMSYALYAQYCTVTLYQQDVGLLYDEDVSMNERNKREIRFESAEEFSKWINKNT